MARFIMQDKRTEVIHERASSLVVQLLLSDQKQFGGTKGDALERMILRASVCTEGRKLLAAEGRQNPTLMPFCLAVLDECHAKWSKLSLAKIKRD